ncbi:hypothetical protein EDC04DRAFT_2784205 [Pisolithus marmoratus]|nr:hypothetical protein EDC04DRAFT_2784205 [Pisolithus marmoratus]
MVGYECLLFAVAFYAALRIYREELGPLRVNRSGVSRLMDIPIEGNVFHFFAVVLFVVFSIVVLLTLRMTWVLGTFNVGFSLAVIIGCHLTLQIRQAVSSTTFVYVSDEDEPAPSWLSVIFPYLSPQVFTSALTYVLH